MSRLIDADSDELEELIYDNTYSPEYHRIMRGMAEWISVKDRLPEKGHYLVVKDVWGNKIIGVCSYANNLEKIDEYDFYGKNHGGWYDYDGEYGYFECDNVTYWMPLPEPPKEDE